MKCSLNLHYSLPAALDHTHLVVGADVQQHGETLLWLNTTTGCVERQLPDRNAHTITSQVTQAEDALPVRHHDGLHREHTSATYRIFISQ